MNLQSVRRALQVAEHHYDLGNALYERVLGESMGYSSAYYRDGAADLTAAQYAKFDVICRKLGLTKGMKVLEIGCGWGTFAAYTSRTYGVEVLGVTVSKEQLAYAKERCAGLPVSFYFGDYRTLPKELEGTFDRAVSIEMIEAVGARNLGAYMDVARRMLTSTGNSSSGRSWGTACRTCGSRRAYSRTESCRPCGSSLRRPKGDSASHRMRASVAITTRP